MASLNLTDLLAAPSLKPGKVPTDEIRQGTHAFVAQLTADERDLLESQWGATRKDSPRGVVGFRAFVVGWTLCDDRNVRTLKPGSDPERLSPEFVEQVEAIGRQHAAALSRLFDVACRKNGLTKQDIEDLEGNFEAPPSDDGSGDKPSPAA